MINFNKKSKLGVLLIIGVIISASIMYSIDVGEKSNGYIMMKETMISYLEFYSLLAEDKSNLILPENCELLLSSPMIELDLRYYIAQEISKALRNDKPILFLIAIELSKAFGGIIQPLDNGYIIFSGNDWAIFLEHGQIMQQSISSSIIVKTLSQTFSWVLLASCNSLSISQMYKNVYGFNGKVTISNILNIMKENYEYNKIYTNIIQKIGITVVL